MARQPGDGGGQKSKKSKRGARNSMKIFKRFACLFRSPSSDLLAEVAALEPVQNDRNEEVIWWCAFCGAQASGPQVRHENGCLWVRICNHVSANDGRTRRVGLGLDNEKTQTRPPEYGAATGSTGPCRRAFSREEMIEEAKAYVRETWGACREERLGMLVDFIHDRFPSNQGLNRKESQ